MSVDLKQVIPLGEFADIRLGLTMRGGMGSRRQLTAGAHLLRIGDLTESGGIRIQAPNPVILDEALLRRFLVSSGDIVIANRGNRMTAAIVPEGLRAVLSGQLLSVRIMSTMVAKEYLHWYLNLERTQKYLLSQSRGSKVKTLSVNVLKRRLRVPVPDRSVQDRLVRAANLAERESELVQGIDGLQKKYVEAFLLSRLEGEE